MPTLPQIANFSSGVGSAPNVATPQSPAKAATPTTPTQSAVGQQIAAKLSDARTKYPGNDDAILTAFMRDNQTTHPDVVTKIKQYTSNDRAMRNNNPTAMTTDVAASLGLKENQDYTTGDPFGQGLHTAKLNGDPIQTTVKAFDNAAANGTPIFQTQGGKPRWTYINLTNDQWKALNPQQKIDTIAHMKTSGEGSKGYSATQVLNALIQDNQAPNPESTDAAASENKVVDDGFNPLKVAKNVIHGAVEPELKAMASGVRSLAAIPQLPGLIKNTRWNDWGVGEGKIDNPVTQTLAKPVLGQKTMGGSTVDENLGSAATGALQAGGLLAGGGEIPGVSKASGLLQDLATSKTVKVVKTIVKLAGAGKAATDVLKGKGSTKDLIYSLPELMSLLK